MLGIFFGVIALGSTTIWWLDPVNAWHGFALPTQVCDTGPAALWWKWLSTVRNLLAALQVRSQHKQATYHQTL